MSTKASEQIKELAKTVVQYIANSELRERICTYAMLALTQHEAEVREEERKRQARMSTDSMLELMNERDSLRAELAGVVKENETLLDSLNYAWSVIANAGGGDWSREHIDWQRAAEKFRDECFHPALSRNKEGGESPLARSPKASRGASNSASEVPSSTCASLSELQKEQWQWVLATFPGETLEGVIRHLKEEVAELEASPTDADELADCFLLVMCAASHAGVDLWTAATQKLAKCKLRKWKKTEAGWRTDKSDESPATFGPDAHPEDRCRKCGGRNIVWFAPNPVWNAINQTGVLCPVCFVSEYERINGRSFAWSLSPEATGVNIFPIPLETIRALQGHTATREKADDRSTASTAEPPIASDASVATPLASQGETPETNKMALKVGLPWEDKEDDRLEHVIDFARNLERERDEARKERDTALFHTAANDTAVEQMVDLIADGARLTKERDAALAKLAEAEKERLAFLPRRGIHHISWVKCPVCGDTEMRREEYAEGDALIFCTNHSCASNGGDNATVILTEPYKVIDTERQRVEKAEAELARVKEDSARLDWLEADKHLTSISATVGGWAFRRVLEQSTFVKTGNAGLRAAIDAARKEKP